LVYGLGYVMLLLLSSISAATAAGAASEWPKLPSTSTKSKILTVNITPLAQLQVWGCSKHGDGGLDGFRLAAYIPGLKDNRIAACLIKFLIFQPVVTTVTFRPELSSS